MIRKATPADIEGVAALGIEALEKNPYPNMVISRQKVMEMTKLCITGAQHFVWVSENDGVIDGSVGVFVHDCMFYERKQASVVQFYCKRPGEGVKLLRQFLTWARSRPIIKMIVFTLEYDVDPRIGKLLSRLGLKTALPVYMETR